MRVESATAAVEKVARALLVCLSGYLAICLSGCAVQDLQDIKPRQLPQLTNLECRDGAGDCCCRGVKVHLYGLHRGEEAARLRNAGVAAVSQAVSVSSCLQTAVLQQTGAAQDMRTTLAQCAWCGGSHGIRKGHCQCRQSHHSHDAVHLARVVQVIY